MARSHDEYPGVETMRLSGPLSKQEVDTMVELIGECSRPWDKKFRCEAHCVYFNDVLD
jgi:hypothetical protein